MSKYYFTHSGTVFMPMRDLYPECLAIIENEPELYPLKCMASSCPRNSNCAERLAHRVNFFFEEVATNEKILLTYFKHLDRPNSVRAGVFHRDMREPRVILCNYFAFKKFSKEGTVYSWDPPESFYLL
jgi:hypothetical protein